MCVCVCVCDVFFCLTVSGFYAECVPKRMYVNASIYTKSRFLGLSLGVHNIGSGTAYVQYVCLYVYIHVQ